MWNWEWGVWNVFPRQQRQIPHSPLPIPPSTQEGPPAPPQAGSRVRRRAREQVVSWASVAAVGLPFCSGVVAARGSVCLTRASADGPPRRSGDRRRPDAGLPAVSEQHGGTCGSAGPPGPTVVGPGGTPALYTKSRARRLDGRRGGGVAFCVGGREGNRTPGVEKCPGNRTVAL
jgi:hypothetical protein